MEIKNDLTMKDFVLNNCFSMLKVTLYLNLYFDLKRP